MTCIHRVLQYAAYCMLIFHLGKSVISSSTFKLETLFLIFSVKFSFPFVSLWSLSHHLDGDDLTHVESSWRPQFTSRSTGRLFTQSEGEFCLFEASKRRNRVLLESTTGYSKEKIEIVTKIVKL